MDSSLTATSKTATYESPHTAPSTLHQPGPQQKPGPQQSSAQASDACKFPPDKIHQILRGNTYAPFYRPESASIQDMDHAREQELKNLNNERKIFQAIVLMMARHESAFRQAYAGLRLKEGAVYDQEGCYHQAMLMADERCGTTDRLLTALETSTQLMIDISCGINRIVRRLYHHTHNSSRVSTSSQLSHREPLIYF